MSVLVFVLLAPVLLLVLLSLAALLQLAQKQDPRCHHLWSQLQREPQSLAAAAY